MKATAVMIYLPMNNCVENLSNITTHATVSAVPKTSSNFIYSVELIHMLDYVQGNSK